MEEHKVDEMLENLRCIIPPEEAADILRKSKRQCLLSTTIKLLFLSILDFAILVITPNNLINAQDPQISMYAWTVAMLYIVFNFLCDVIEIVHQKVVQRRRIQFGEKVSLLISYTCVLIFIERILRIGSASAIVIICVIANILSHIYRKVVFLKKKLDDIIVNTQEQSKMLIV